MKKIGVITSGGDCGGLNAVIKGSAGMSNNLGIKCYVIPNGYTGLYNLVDFDTLVELTPERVDQINVNLAGSEAGHSRVKIKKITDDKKYERIKEGLKKFDIDALVISGGDDTGSVIIDLDKHGFSCIHVPKTMDLDLQTYSIGGDSTINRIAIFINDLKTTAYTHNRIIVLEVFGRYAGHTAFRGGICGDADAILIPEIPVDFDSLYVHAKNRYMQRINKSDVKSGSYIIVVAEGIEDASGKEIVDESAGVDAFRHKKLAGAGKYVCQELTKRFKADPEITDFMKNCHLFMEGIYDIPETRHVTPGHLVRCGHTSAYDANFGMECGAAAVFLLKKGIKGVTVASVSGQEILYMKIEQAIQQRRVDLNQIAIHESLGKCFGRKPKKFSLKPKEIKDSPERYM
ncbi:MAG: 6-phosphofructokinase [Candidatus Omnitrophica bacterium]|nr:6-phosphofructokinase [Candidatus Omnitrophota bacterium]